VTPLHSAARLWPLGPGMAAEPQAPAGGRLLVLVGGVLFNVSFPGPVARPRDEGASAVPCPGHLSPPYRASLCSRSPASRVERHLTISHRPHVFSLPLFSYHLFSVEKYVPMPRYSKVFAVFCRPGCSSRSKTAS